RSRTGRRNPLPALFTRRQFHPDALRRAARKPPPAAAALHHVRFPVQRPTAVADRLRTSPGRAAGTSARRVSAPAGHRNPGARTVDLRTLGTATRGAQSAMGGAVVHFRGIVLRLRDGELLLRMAEAGRRRWNARRLRGALPAATARGPRPPDRRRAHRSRHWLFAARPSRYRVRGHPRTGDADGAAATAPAAVPAGRRGRAGRLVPTVDAVSEVLSATGQRAARTPARQLATARSGRVDRSGHCRRLSSARAREDPRL